MRVQATCHEHDSIDQMNEHLTAALAELNDQLDEVLAAELARLQPWERRLFRADLAPIRQHIEGHANHVVIVLECDPPRVYLVAPGSPEDSLTTEQATRLVKAGAGACTFATDGDCQVALCDACHPEQWAERRDKVSV